MSDKVSKIATVFDSEEQHVGQLYARALLQAASSDGQVDVVVDQLESFVGDVLAKTPSLETILSNPKMSADDKIGILDRVFSGSMNGTLLKFLKVLCRRQRVQFVRAIARSAAAPGPCRRDWCSPRATSPNRSALGPRRCPCAARGATAALHA